MKKQTNKKARSKHEYYLNVTLIENRIKELSKCKERLELMREHKVINKIEYKNISRKIRKELNKTTKELKEWGLI